MSYADDLLTRAAEEGENVSAAGTGDNEEHIVIGRDRLAIIPESLRKIAVQFDHNVETLTFDCPRYWDDTDFSTMKIAINYMRPDGVLGSYICEGATVDETDPNIIHFEWKISSNVTPVKGTISFLVCIKEANEDQTHWSSELNRDLYVTEGLNCDEVILSRYPDIVAQILNRMSAVEALPPTVQVIRDDADGRGKYSITITDLNGEYFFKVTETTPFDLDIYDEYKTNYLGTLVITRKTARCYIDPNTTEVMVDDDDGSGYNIFVDVRFNSDADYFNSMQLDTEHVQLTSNLFPKSDTANAGRSYYMERNEITGKYRIRLNYPSLLKYDSSGALDYEASEKRVLQYFSANPTYIIGLLKEEYWYNELVPAGEHNAPITTAQGTWVRNEVRKGINLFNPYTDLDSAYARIGNGHEGRILIDIPPEGHMSFASVNVTPGMVYTISFQGKRFDESNPTSSDWIALAVLDGRDEQFVDKGYSNVLASKSGIAADGNLSDTIKVTFTAKRNWISLYSQCSDIRYLMLSEGPTQHPWSAYHGKTLRESDVFTTLDERYAAKEEIAETIENIEDMIDSLEQGTNQTYVKKTELEDGTVIAKQAHNAYTANGASFATKDQFGNVIDETYCKTENLTNGWVMPKAAKSIHLDAETSVPFTKVDDFTVTATLPDYGIYRIRVKESVIRMGITMKTFYADFGFVTIRTNNISSPPIVFGAPTTAEALDGSININLASMFRLVHNGDKTVSLQIWHLDFNTGSGDTDAKVVAIADGDNDDTYELLCTYVGPAAQ